MKNMKTQELERSVVNLLNPRINAIVPNVSWGLGLRHECDLLCLDKQNRFTEIELKVSRQDLRNDFKKTHGHISDIISRLVYAVPEEIIELALEIVPKKHGIIVCENVGKFNHLGERTGDHFISRWVRINKHDDHKRPSLKQIDKFLRLGVIRIWKLSIK